MLGYRDVDKEKGSGVMKSRYSRGGSEWRSAGNTENRHRGRHRHRGGGKISGVSGIWNEDR